jgi:molybdenum cofactor cytidylyltransferase
MRKKGEIKKIGAIILAAGSSSRLGKPKQLLIFEGESLLEKAINAAQKSDAECFVVILGSNAAKIRSKIDFGSLNFLINKQWSSGMASSMQLGLNYLIQKHQIEAVVLLLSDQPYTNAEILNSIINMYYETGKGIIASTYQKTYGVPALFDKKYFGEMLALKSTEGAKKIILTHMEDTGLMDFPLGAIDIDTVEDYEKLSNQSLN